MTAYIGIDPTGGTRPITFAVLNDELQVEKLQTAMFDEVVEAVLSYPTAYCAIDAPIERNLGYLTDPEFRERVGLEPDSETYSTYRVCEFELRRRGIYIYNTPPDEDRISDWMKKGWELYEHLMKEGYVRIFEAGPRHLFETYPQACFTVLLGNRPYPKNSLEGRIQRQLVLFDHRVRVPDPMHVFGELTRYRLLTSRLELGRVYSDDELDALVAAYTSYVVAHEPERATAVGLPDEGQIIIPTEELKDSYT